MSGNRVCRVGVLVLMGVLLTASPVRADDGGFAETFDDTGLAGWEQQGDTIVEAGILKMSPPSMVTRPGTWSGISLTVELRLDAEGFAVIDYMVTEGQHYSLTVLSEQVFLEQVTEDDQVRLWETTDSTVTDDWSTVTIGFDGTDHTVTINDSLLATVADSNPLAAGGVRLHIPAGSLVEFDEVTLVAQSGDAGELGETAPEPAEEMTPIPGEEMPPGEQDTPPVEGQTGAVADPASETTTDTGFFSDFFATQPNNVELRTFAVNLGLAAIVAYILSLAYIHWGASLSNRRVFAANFMLLTLTTTSIILVVRSSVALSLGLVGALSIVRFRAAIKEPEELAYLFLAIGLGIGLGDNQRLVVLLTLVVAIVVIGLMKLFRNPTADPNLHLAVASNAPNKVGLEDITNVLDQHCSQVKLLRFDEDPDTLETSFLVEFKRVSDVGQTNAALQALSPGMQVTLLDNRGIW
ncbi:MAG: DUF4956 domain-containing protein [Acidimicrobiia bacterium]|nr:DUF4956 domain-containing protein [Acidimicrobiia bacterium]